MCLEKLLKQITETREQMILVTNEKGMNHDEAIKISMELDLLLNDYQKKLSKQI
jgi:adenosyl cobinamide kinase/adenosyl cobinamide phosphate guanylyltransferase